MRVFLNPPVKVIVVVLCLSPEVEKHQREAERRHEQSEAGTFQLPAAETKHETGLSFSLNCPLIHGMCFLFFLFFIHLLPCFHGGGRLICDLCEERGLKAGNHPALMIYILISWRFFFGLDDKRHLVN